MDYKNLSLCFLVINLLLKDDQVNYLLFEKGAPQGERLITGKNRGKKFIFPIVFNIILISISISERLYNIMFFNLSI